MWNYQIFKVYGFSKCINTTGKYFKFRILENLQQLLSTFSDCVCVIIQIVILLFHIKLLINDQLFKKMVINCLLNMDYHVWQGSPWDKRVYKRQSLQCNNMILSYISWPKNVTDSFQFFLILEPKKNKNIWKKIPKLDHS